MSYQLNALAGLSGVEIIQLKKLEVLVFHAEQMKLHLRIDIPLRLLMKVELSSVLMLKSGH